VDFCDDGRACLFCVDGEESHAESPYVMNLRSEWPFLAASAGMFTAGYVIRQTDGTLPYTRAELDMLDRSSVNGFDRLATYNWNQQHQDISDVLLLVSLATPTLFLASEHTRHDIGKLSLMGLEVVLFSSGLTSAIKATVNRTRPFVYNPELDYEIRRHAESRRSFISGHTSFSSSICFFVAKVMTDYHPDMKTGWKVGIWTFSAALPATVATLRVTGGKHYPTDVLTGYAVGALSGVLIPHLHKKQKKQGKNSKLQLYPSQAFGEPTLGLSLKLD
jgi:membrane-associated phospholipid phosphatase